MMNGNKARGVPVKNAGAPKGGKAKPFPPKAKGKAKAKK